MPLPVAHSLVSTSVFVAYSGRLGLRDNYRWIALFVFMGLLPDSDFITLPFAGFGLHRGLSHSIVFTIVVSTLAYALVKAFKPQVTTRLWFFLALAMTLHPICDYFTPDLLETRGGVMLFYPFTSAYFESPYPIFMGIELRYLETIFSFHTVLALLYETLLAGALLAAIILIKRLSLRPVGSITIKRAED